MQLIRKTHTPKAKAFWERAEYDESHDARPLPQWKTVGVIVPQDLPIRK